MKDTVLEDNKRKFWTVVFVSFLSLFGVLCIGVMNSKYDSLARYPYKDRESREIIREKLNKTEIEYIIEYSIPPNMFISFINENGFTIYHAAEYKKLSEYCWQESPAMIVRMVEETYDDLTVDGLIALLGHYTYDELHYYLENGDSYVQGTVLVENAGDMDAWVDYTHSISVHAPGNLMVLNEEVPSEEGYEIVVSENIQQPLLNLCEAMQKDLYNMNGCGGILVTEGYVSYSAQEERYLLSDKDGSIPAPGHNEHQLGLAVDFAVRGLNGKFFALTEQSKWLEDNAFLYGFVRTYTSDTEMYTGISDVSNHYRYIGEELAQQLHEENISFAEYSISKVTGVQQSPEE